MPSRQAALMVVGAGVREPMGVLELKRIEPIGRKDGNGVGAESAAG